MSRYFPDRNIIPRVRRFVEENRNANGYVDVDIMVEGLQQQYPDYRRQKKILFKKNVQAGILFYFWYLTRKVSLLIR